MVDGIPPRRRRADRQPESPVLAVEARAERLERREPRDHVGDRRLSATQPAARDHVDHGSSSWRRLPEAVLVGRGGNRWLRRIARHPARNWSADWPWGTAARAAQLPEGAADI